MAFYREDDCSECFFIRNAGIEEAFKPRHELRWLDLKLSCLYFHPKIAYRKDFEELENDCI